MAERAMRVGYCVPNAPQLASFRLRVDIPSKHLGIPYAIGTTGNPTFFFKNGNVTLAESCPGAVVYDVVNDHFRGSQARDYHAMCSIATVITCASEVMAERVKFYTGRDATVIDDPYESDELEPVCYGNGVAWFGHSANLSSLVPYLEDVPVIVCSNYAKSHVPWSLANEQKVLQGCAVAFLTGSNPGASTNRVVKAIRAGRFVVAPSDCPASWRQFEPHIWVGDVQDGIAWALNNREEACNKTLAGQAYIRQRFSPQLIGSQWADLFASTLGRDTRSMRAGSA
jgi:hypothetical protein